MSPGQKVLKVGFIFGMMSMSQLKSVLDLKIVSIIKPVHYIVTNDCLFYVTIVNGMNWNV